MKHFNRTVTVLVFIFLYIPMIVLAVASFNTGTDIASFKGFTLRQYANLFRDGTLLTLLRNSVIIALLACVASLLGIYVDLFASVVKRQCGIKDYGTIFPGHGGILDRFDSVMFIAPFVTMVITAVFYA